MKVAVVGGTGTVGRHTVDALRRAKQDPVVVARSRGIDVTTGTGLDRALEGVEVVIDVSSLQGPDEESTRNLFEAEARNLLAAEKRAGVKHHVLISIVGLDRVRGNGHVKGKRFQEQLAAESGVPFTLQRATQFHEFPATVVGWVRNGDSATLPPLLIQPVAASDVGEVLAELAGRPPQGRVADLAGPQTEDFVDMARRTLAARGESIRLIASWRNAFADVEQAGEVLLPGPEARLAKTTFDAWLVQERAAAESRRTNR